MVCLDKVAYFTLEHYEQKPKKRAIHDALFEPLFKDTFLGPKLTGCNDYIVHYVIAELHARRFVPRVGGAP